MIPIKVLVPSGVLGLGFDLEALNNGVKNNPDPPQGPSFLKIIAGSKNASF